MTGLAADPTGPRLWRAQTRFDKPEQPVGRSPNTDSSGSHFDTSMNGFSVGGTPLPAPRAPRYGNVTVRAPVHARGYEAGRRVRCRCVAERASALKARVLHARAWNVLRPHLKSISSY